MDRLRLNAGVILDRTENEDHFWSAAELPG